MTDDAKRPHFHDDGSFDLEGVDAVAVQAEVFSAGSGRLELVTSDDGKWWTERGTMQVGSALVSAQWRAPFGGRLGKLRCSADIGAPLHLTWSVDLLRATGEPEPKRET